VRRPANRFFTYSFLGADPNVSARAVAAVDLEDTCVYALNPTIRGAVKVAGGATVNLSCGIKVNSIDTAALDQSSAGSCLSSTLIKIHAPGWYDGPCVNATEGIYTTVAVKDPMLLVDPPVDPNTLTCDHTAKIMANSGDHVVLDPGTYCNSIETVSTGQITFNPGLYVLHGAALKVSASGSLQGDGVTFYITPDASASDSINFQAGATVDLKAPTAGEAGMPGILFYQDRNAPTNLTHHFTAEANMNLEGTLYFPTSQVNFAGGSSLDAKAVMLIVDTLSFTGQSHVGEFEGSVIESNPSLITAILLE